MNHPGNCYPISFCFGGVYLKGRKSNGGQERRKSSDES